MPLAGLEVLVLTGFEISQEGTTADFGFVKLKRCRCFSDCKILEGTGG